MKRYILTALFFGLLAGCGGSDDGPAADAGADTVEVVAEDTAPDTPGLDLPKGFTGKKDLH